MRKKRCKPILIGTIISMITVFTILCFPDKEIQAEETAGKAVRFQEVAYADFWNCINAKKAPECVLVNENGECNYLFAGWYRNDEKTVLKTANEVSIGENVKAKFVSSYVSGVACQVTAGFDEAIDSKVDMRIASIVDSSKYQKVGFNIYGRMEDGTEWTMYAYDEEGKPKAESTIIYNSLQEYKLEGTQYVPDGAPKKPEEVFGNIAEGFKFTTVKLTDIPKEYFSTIIAIKPYWITLDGTVVEAMGEFNRVTDGNNNIINISINVKEAKEIAAGMMEVNYPTYFSFVSADFGRVFEEMEYTDTGSSIKCVGNVADISNNTETPNDVYINLRFQKKGSEELVKGETEFKVKIPEDGFCDNLENIKNVEAWSVKY